MGKKVSKRKNGNRTNEKLWLDSYSWPRWCSCRHLLIKLQPHLLLRFVLFFSFSTFILTARSQEKSLDYFIDAALQSSPLLKDYNNLLLINAIDSARVIAGYKPQV